MTSTRKLAELPESFDDCQDTITRAAWIILNADSIRVPGADKAAPWLIASSAFERVIDELIASNDKIRASIFAIMVLDYHYSSALNSGAVLYCNTSDEVKNAITEIYLRKISQFYFLPMSCNIDHRYESLSDKQSMQCLTMLYSAKFLIEHNVQDPNIEFLNRFPMRESSNREGIFFETILDAEYESFKSLTDPLPSPSSTFFPPPVFLTLANGVANFYGKTMEAFIASHDTLGIINPEYHASAKEAALTQLREHGFQIAAGKKM